MRSFMQPAKCFFTPCKGNRVILNRRSSGGAAAVRAESCRRFIHNALPGAPNIIHLLLRLESSEKPLFTPTQTIL